MDGYQVTFFTQQSRSHQGKPLVDWLVHLSGELGLRGVTVIPASIGIGHDHQLHSAHFFELSDQPVLVIMVVTAEECARLFARLENETVKICYTKAAVTFGTVGKDPN
jgi:PII-like signaling protein